MIRAGGRACWRACVGSRCCARVVCGLVVLTPDGMAPGRALTDVGWESVLRRTTASVEDYETAETSALAGAGDRGNPGTADRILRLFRKPSEPVLRGALAAVPRHLLRRQPNLHGPTSNARCRSVAGKRFPTLHRRFDDRVAGADARVRCWKSAPVQGIRQRCWPVWRGGCTAERFRVLAGCRTALGRRTGIAQRGNSARRRLSGLKRRPLTLVHSHGGGGQCCRRWCGSSPAAGWRFPRGRSTGVRIRA